MNEPTGHPRPDFGRGRKTIACLVLGSLALVLPTSVNAGAIRTHALRARATHTVTASAANPWGSYWQNALKHHMLRVAGPRAVSILSLSADGTLPASPLAEYMLWRQGLNTKQFDSFHPEVAKLLRKIKLNQTPPITNPPTNPSEPGVVIPPGTRVPILPPDFVPTTPSQEVVPPQVPEPSSGLIAVAMIGTVAMARRWRNRIG